MSIIRRAIEQLEGLETIYSTQIESTVKSGKPVPGWILEPGKGREVWNKPTGEILALGMLSNIDLKKPDQVMTPKQARDKGLNHDLVKQYSHTPKRGLKLVEDTGDKARKLFTF